MLQYYGSMLDRIVSMPYMLMLMQNHLQGETDSIQYGASGHLKASLNKDSKNSNYQLKISLKEGWHINSHTPIQKNLIKSEVNLAQKVQNTKIKLENIHYPEASIKKLGFSQTRLSLYEKNIEIRFKISVKKKNRKVIPVQFKFQACSDNTCLAPEAMIFYLTQ